MNQVTSAFVKFLLFFVMPVTVETILSEGTSVQVCLMITSTIGVFEQVRVWFTFLSLKFWRVYFLVCFITPSKVMIMFGFMKTIAFNIFSLLDSA